MSDFYRFYVCVLHFKPADFYLEVSSASKWSKLAKNRTSISLIAVYSANGIVVGSRCFAAREDEL